MYWIGLIILTEHDDYMVSIPTAYSGDFVLSLIASYLEWAIV
jgi:hypothetical protein